MAAFPKPPKRGKGRKDGLERKVWDMASKFVRVRDAGPNGYCRCICCGTWDHWKDMDAGHYINRQYTTIWLNEININAQARSCNRFNEGNQVNYRIGLVQKYGEQKVLLLEASKGYKKWVDYELNAKYEYFKREFKRLKDLKGL